MMSGSAVIFSHGEGVQSMIIIEQPSQLSVKLGSGLAPTYRQWFNQVASSEVGMDGTTVWRFSRSKKEALSMLTRITQKDFGAYYKVPTPTLISNPSVVVPSFQMSSALGGNTAQLLAMSQPIQTKTVPQGQYPRYIFRQNVEDGMLILADYSAKSFVLFTPKKWGMTNSQYLKSVRGKLGYRFKTESGGTAAGWLFAKSNDKAVEFLNQLTKLDVLKEAPRIGPAYQKKENGWNSQKPGHPSLPGAVQDPTVPEVEVPKGKAYKVQEIEAANPIDALSRLVEMAAEEKGFIQQNLGVSNGVVKTGFFGTKEEVEENVELYKESNEGDEITLVATITIGEKVCSIWSRKLEEDDD